MFDLMFSDGFRDSWIFGDGAFRVDPDQRDAKVFAGRADGQTGPAAVAKLRPPSPAQAFTAANEFDL
jgi:hypothetical protein